MPTLLNFVLVTLFAFGPTACIENGQRTTAVFTPAPVAGGGDDKGGGDKGGDKKDGDNKGGGDSTVKVPDSIVGTWLSPCTSSFTGAEQTMRIYKANGEFEILFSNYSERCSQQMDFSNSRKGTFTATASTTVQGGFNINATLKSFEILPGVQASVDLYNETSLCNFKDWRLGVAKEVLALACATTNFVTLKSDDLEFDLILPSNTQLKVGLRDVEKTGFHSESKRPTAIDPNAVYIKR